MSTDPPTPDDTLARTYDADFYGGLANDVRASASVIVPLVVELLEPRSVLDVGCGRGTWLAQFRHDGVDDVVGIDGAHVAPADLEIPADRFLPRDLTAPFDLGRRFDLVLSLEVAEHIDARYAATFIDSLVAHGSVVMFSAAIPFQGGAGHVNEQWPSYWARHFARHDYRAFDVVRPAVWTDDRVSFWYAQNVLLYVDGKDAPTLQRVAARAAAPLEVDVVHPRLHERDHEHTPTKSAPPSLSRLLRELGPATMRALRHRAGRGPSPD